MSAKVAVARIQLSRIVEFKKRVNKGLSLMYLAAPTVFFLNVHDTAMAMTSSMWVVGIGGLVHLVTSLGTSEELARRENTLARECDAANVPFEEKKRLKVCQEVSVAANSKKKRWVRYYTHLTSCRRTLST